MPEPTLVTDEHYKTMLLELLEIGDPADSAYRRSIEELEQMCVNQGLQLPIVRRIVPDAVDADQT